MSIISLKQLDSLTEEEKKKTMQDLRSQNTISAIAREWGVSTSSVYKRMRMFEVSVPTGQSEKKTKASSKTAKGNTEKSVVKTKRKADPQEPPLVDEKDTSLSAAHKYAMNLSVNGDMEYIKKVLRSLAEQDFLTDTDYHLSIILEEG
ncbi:MAG TPA: hypothetical protein VN426_09530 [Syntrophomonadaceae bacterium]|nr:hypothetical protein [Syntrophomonadaceae bacterium]